MTGIPRPVNWLISSAKSVPATFAFPKISAISPIGAPTPADTSPILRSVSVTSPAEIPNAISDLPASANSGNSNGVSAPSCFNSSSVFVASPASPIKVLNETLSVSMSAASLTALNAPAAIPAAATAAPVAAIVAVAFKAAAPSFFIEPTAGAIAFPIFAPVARATVCARRIAPWNFVVSADISARMFALAPAMSNNPTKWRFCKVLVFLPAETHKGRMRQAHPP